MKKAMLIVALTLVASPAFAEEGGHGKSHHFKHHFSHVLKSVKRHHDAPLPLAAGLPALALMGGALALARRGRKD